MRALRGYFPYRRTSCPPLPTTSNAPVPVQLLDTIDKIHYNNSLDTAKAESGGQMDDLQARNQALITEFRAAGVCGGAFARPPSAHHHDHRCQERAGAYDPDDACPMVTAC